MIIYCVNFPLKSSSSFDRVIATTAKWLGKKYQSYVDPAWLSAANARPIAGLPRIEVASTYDEYPHLYALRIHERDSEVSGRKWMTEVGLRRDAPDGEIQFSILLQSSESGTLVPAPDQTSRPLLVPNVQRECEPSPSTPGLTMKRLDSKADVEAFPYEVELDNRTYPILLVSPTPDGEYLISPENLVFYLGGLAEIVLISPEADTFLLSRVVGEQYAAWRGAINIIFPQVRGFGRSYIPTKRLLAEDIQAIGAESKRRAEAILANICRHTNLPNSRRHLSVEQVIQRNHDSSRRNTLARLREEARKSGETTELAAMLEQDNLERIARIGELERAGQKLQNERDELEAMWSASDEQLTQLKYELASYKQQYLDAVSAARSADGCLNEDDRFALEQTFSRCPTPEQALRTMVLLFGDRIEVLQSAWESAKESEAFKEKGALLDLLSKLCMAYWEALAAGRGDVAAHTVFGKNEYAANEGEAGANPRARQRRIFNYNGTDVEMLKHLKIGRKDSPYETIRVHFEWFADEKKIVIGYCGPHLDHK